MTFEIPAGWKPSVTKTDGDKTFIFKAADFNLQDEKTHISEIVNAYILEKLQFYKITEKKD